MNLTIISATFTTIGEIVIAYTVISVHHRVMKEHKIDDLVFKTMRKEQIIALIGIILIITGYTLNVAIALGV